VVMISLGQVKIDQTLPGRRKVSMGQSRGRQANDLESHRKSCDRKISDARKLLAQHEWYKARTALEKAAAMAVDKGQASAIGPLLMQIDQEGRRQVKLAAGEYRQGRYISALKAFESISTVFGQLPSGQLARQELAQSKSDPLVRKAIEESKALAMDQLILNLLKTGRPGQKSPTTRQASSQPASRPSRVGAIKALSLKKQDRILRLLERIAGRFPDCKTGQLAVADLAQLRRDEEFFTKLSAYRVSRQARLALSNARMYHNSGMKAKAIESYNEVIRRFGDTPEAAEAKRKLATLGAPDPG